MREWKLTKEQERLLHEQVIDQSRPGTILHDAATALDFVGAGGVKAGGKYNLLPTDAIRELDERLSRPLRLTLARPQLRSHPYLQGLHLVLRATGLLQVEGSGEKAKLVVPAEVRERWDQLNPTEQYFALLEGWLFFSRPEMVGERESIHEGGLVQCLTAWQALPPKGRTRDPRDREPLYLPFLYGDQYHMALMDLFGLIRIEHPAKPGQPWSPQHIEHSPFGDAVFTLLASRLLDVLTMSDDAEATEAEGMHTVFQPYFPELQNNWSVDAGEMREGVFVFRVSISKGVYRVIAIDARDTLDDLMDAILASINFDHDHLYEFSYRDRFGATVRAAGPITDGELGTDEVLIGELPLDPGQSMNLIYDFGDNWQFTVKLERIDPAGKKRAKPKVVERRGTAPKQYRDWD